MLNFLLRMIIKADDKNVFFKWTKTIKDIWELSVVHHFSSIYHDFTKHLLLTNMSSGLVQFVCVAKVYLCERFQTDSKGEGGREGRETEREKGETNRVQVNVSESLLVFFLVSVRVAGLFWCQSTVSFDSLPGTGPS